MQLVVTSMMHYGPQWNLLTAEGRIVKTSQASNPLLEKGEKKFQAHFLFFLTYYGIRRGHLQHTFTLLNNNNSTNNKTIIIVWLLLTFKSPYDLLALYHMDLLKLSHLIFITTQWGNYRHYLPKEKKKYYICSLHIFPRIIHQKSCFMCNSIEIPLILTRWWVL